jgi:type 2A phosphatase activator TIP41
MFYLIPSQNKSEIKEVLPPYDWTYTTFYQGTDDLTWSPSTNKFNITLLSKTDAILYYSHVIMFEDELADNGSSILSVRTRVMTDCYLVLLRFFLRVDSVLFRIVDTRFYCGFDGVVLKSHIGRECDYDTVLQVCL